jgi:hypothetical protein
MMRKRSEARGTWLMSGRLPLMDLLYCSIVPRPRSMPQEESGMSCSCEGFVFPHEVSRRTCAFELGYLAGSRQRTSPTHRDWEPHSTTQWRKARWAEVIVGHEVTERHRRRCSWGRLGGRIGSRWWSGYILSSLLARNLASLLRLSLIFAGHSLS